MLWGTGNMAVTTPEVPSIKIGGASGYWGESAMATPQLLQDGTLDYLVYDYLAEITMSIMARAKAKDPSKGYATDFIETAMRPHLKHIAKSGVKIISNAGGVNPEACAARLRTLISDAGLNLKVAVITGDNILSAKHDIASQGPRDMFSQAPCPASDKIMSINVYLGAFPIAKALAAGADIVITGRCVDSAVTLGACIYEFGWKNTDWDLLASGALAGHILECGPQATGGNFTDWDTVGDIANIGYPIAEIFPDGSFITTKPEGTEGLVNIGTVSEQMLYEIGDPQAYILPDVMCDFSDVTLSQLHVNAVKLSPAKGRPPPRHYKTCLTYQDGFRAGIYATFYGIDAARKAETFAQAALARTRRTLQNYKLGHISETSQEILGAGSQMGPRSQADSPPSANEVVLKLAIKHADIKGTALFLKEVAGIGLATPPGLSGFTGVRSKPSPVVRLHSYLTPKQDIDISLDIEGDLQTFNDALTPSDHDDILPSRMDLPPPQNATQALPLISLAWGRSGDKGNKANIGIIARKPEYLPYIWAALDTDFIRATYAHFLKDRPAAIIDRFLLPGSHAMNILIDDALGGGGAASLRNDAQGKGFAQILLAQTVKVSPAIAKAL